MKTEKNLYVYKLTWMPDNAYLQRLGQGVKAVLDSMMHWWEETGAGQAVCYASLCLELGQYSLCWHMDNVRITRLSMLQLKFQVFIEYGFHKTVLKCNELLKKAVWEHLTSCMCWHHCLWLCLKCRNNTWKNSHCSYMRGTAEKNVSNRAAVTESGGKTMTYRNSDSFTSWKLCVWELITVWHSIGEEWVWNMKLTWECC